MPRSLFFILLLLQPSFQKTSGCQSLISSQLYSGGEFCAKDLAPEVLTAQLSLAGSFQNAPRESLRLHPAPGGRVPGGAGVWDPQPLTAVQERRVLCARSSPRT